MPKPPEIFNNLSRAQRMLRWLADRGPEGARQVDFMHEYWRQLAIRLPGDKPDRHHYAKGQKDISGHFGKYMTSHYLDDQEQNQFRVIERRAMQRAPDLLNQKSYRKPFKRYCTMAQANDEGRARHRKSTLRQWNKERVKYGDSWAGICTRWVSMGLSEMEKDLEKAYDLKFSPQADPLCSYEFVSGYETVFSSPETGRNLLTWVGPDPDTYASLLEMNTKTVAKRYAALRDEFVQWTDLDDVDDQLMDLINQSDAEPILNDLLIERGVDDDVKRQDALTCCRWIRRLMHPKLVKGLSGA